MQCQMCQQSLRGESEHGSFSKQGQLSYRHYASSIDICTASREGCHLCSVLWNLLSPEDISRILGHHQDSRDDLKRTSIIKRDPVRISVSVRDVKPGDAGDKNLQIAFPLDFPTSDDRYGRFCVKEVGLVPAQGTRDRTQCFPRKIGTRLTSLNGQQRLKHFGMITRLPLTRRLMQILRWPKNGSILVSQTMPAALTMLSTSQFANCGFPLVL